MTDTIHNFAHAATAIPLGLLEQHFSRAEARRPLDTAIDWGRYAEVLRQARSPRNAVRPSTP